MKATLYRIVFGDYHKGKNHAETTLHTTAVEHKKHNEKHAKVEDCSRNDTHAANIQQRQRHHWQCLAMPGNAFCCFVVCMCCKIMYRSERPETAACRECVRQSLAGD